MCCCFVWKIDLGLIAGKYGRSVWAFRCVLSGVSVDCDDVWSTYGSLSRWCLISTVLDSDARARTAVAKTIVGNKFQDAGRDRLTAEGYRSR